MKKLSNYIIQTENQLNALQDCVIKLNLQDYDLNDSIVINEEENIIWVKSLLSRIEFEDIEFDLILDYPVDLNIIEMKKIDSEYIDLYYKKNELILETSLQKEDFKQQVRYLNRLLGGKEIYKDSDHLFMRLYNTYRDITDMDLVHLEVLISNVLRDKANPAQPARLGKTFDPIMMGIKDIIFKEGVLQGLSFENLGKGIANALVSDTVKEPSILERVLMNEIIQKK